MGLVGENGNPSLFAAHLTVLGTGVPRIIISTLNLLLCRGPGDSTAPDVNVDPGVSGSTNLEAQLSGIDLNPPTTQSGIHGPLASDIQGSSSQHLASSVQASSSQHLASDIQGSSSQH